MNHKLEELKAYRDILMDIKQVSEIYYMNMRKQAEEYLDKQTNDKFDIYTSVENREKNKVKVLSLYRY